MPNGCDCRGCCDIDLNGNGTRERLLLGFHDCRFVTPTDTPDVEGGPCTPGPDGGAGSCRDAALRCVPDGDGARHFCTRCAPCRLGSEETPPIAGCAFNPCDATERCLGDRSPAWCPGDGGARPPWTCPAGVAACLSHGDCRPQGERFACFAGCCVEFP